MIYLVTLNQELFDNDAYKIISVDESLHFLSKYNMLQADSETDGRDAHINKLSVEHMLKHLQMFLAL